MGEYATYQGEQIKIGTCEDLYYLRADQRFDVEPLVGHVDPVADMDRGVRFRFPWPDEDDTAPGMFRPHDRAVWVPGLTAPPSLDHHQVQFSASAGYNVCLPCPESAESRLLPLTIHRNGFRGAVLISQQRYFEGRWVLVCRCGGCNSAYRLPVLADAEPVIVACRGLADVARHQHNPDGHLTEWWHVVANRITAGYVFGSAGPS